MKRALLACLLVISLQLVQTLSAQTIIYSEDFESGTPPTGWTLSSNVSAVGWQFGTTLGSADFAIPSHTRYAASNDDLYDDASATLNLAFEDYLISPLIDLSGAGSLIILEFEYFQTGEWGSAGYTWISTDTGATWNFLSTVTPGFSWTTHGVDISAYAGSNVMIRFHHDDGGAWADGFAIDDVVVRTGVSRDAALIATNLPEFSDTGTYFLNVDFRNEGVNDLSYTYLSYSVDGGPAVTELAGPWIVPTGSEVNWTHSTPIALSTPGIHTICVWHTNVNGLGADEDTSNDTICIDVNVIDNPPARNPVLEISSATWAGYSPDADVAWDTITSIYPEASRVTLQTFGAMNTSEVNTVTTAYLPAIPAAVIDRFKFESESDIDINRPNWSARISDRLEMPTPVNVWIDGIEYTSGTRTFDITIKSEFHADVTGDYRVNVIVVEDSVTGFGSSYDQTNYYDATGGHPYFGAGDPIVGYNHRYVLRDYLATEWGMPSSYPGSIPKGVIYTHSFSYTAPVGQDVDQMHFIGLVQKYSADTEDREIMNGSGTIPYVPCSSSIASFSESLSGLSASFFSTASGTVDSWTWDFGDGAGSSMENPLHTYSSPGTYSVCLITTNPCGSDTSCRSITVSSGGAVGGCDTSITTLGATPNILPLCLGSAFSDTVTLVFPDDTTITAPAPLTIPYDSIEVIGVDGLPVGMTYSCISDCVFPNTGSGLIRGCLEFSGTPVALGAYGTYFEVIVEIYIDVFGSPTVLPDTIRIDYVSGGIGAADFLYSVSGTTVSFSDITPSPVPSSWSWNFGDGGTSGIQNPSHSYSSTGTYNVCLDVSNACGVDSICKFVVVTSGGSSACDTSITTPGVHPDNMTLCYGSAISEDFTIVFPVDTVISIPSFPPLTVFFDSVTVLDVIGLPPGLSYTCAPGCTMIGGGIQPKGCLNIAGTPSGPGSFGTYFMIEVEQWTTVFGSPIPFLDTLTVTYATGAIGSPAFTYSASGSTLSFTDLTGSPFPTAWFWDFDDGSTSSLQDPTHTFGGSGPYEVCLSVINDCAVNTVCDTISLAGCSAPTGSFGYSSSFLTTNFTDLSSGSPTGWLWDFGDGITSTLANPTHTYAAPGSYTVCLQVTNSCSTDTYCELVTVTSCTSPTADFISSTSGLIFSGTDISTGSPSSYLWDFGDGGSSTSPTPSHSYSVPGTYTVCLTVSNACGSDITCKVVTVTCSSPVAGYTQSISGTAVSFADLSTNVPTSWFWDFGDGTSSTLENPSHTYTVGGAYTVCLTVTNGCGSDTQCNTVTVSCTAPVADLLYTTSGTAVDFTDISAGGPTSWTWTFGDGGSSSLEDPSHVYSTAGTYTVCLSVSNGCGSDTQCETITVTCSSPTGAISSTSTGLDASFSASTSGGVTGYLWSFGDGSTSTDPAPSHTYGSSGDYTVCLEVSNACGSSTSCSLVSVCANPIAGFGYSTTGLDFSFIDTTINGATSWTWTFGDGGSSLLQNPSHSYGSPGSFTVCLTATNACGSSTQCSTVVALITGLETAMEDEHILVYPNPGSGQLSIQFEQDMLVPVVIQLVDMRGKILRSDELVPGVKGNVIQMDYASLAKGMYFLTIKGPGSERVIKVIFE